MYDLFLKYINHMVKIKNNNSGHPMKSKKYAVIMACHCDSTTKLDVIINNLQYFDYLNVDTIIINSSELDLGNKLSDSCSIYLNTSYYEIPNSCYYDFGKWVYALQNVIKVNEYDYVVLTNDSFIINSSINHFFNLTAVHNVELYGYNDSTQTRYHYQSYLFSLRKDAVNTFIDKVTDKSLNINSQEDVIINLEIRMTDWFVNKKCFLTIGNFKLHKFKNIFFTNDKLYKPLKSSKLLPFIKLKRILKDNNELYFNSYMNLKVNNIIMKNNNNNNSSNTNIKKKNINHKMANTITNKNLNNNNNNKNSDNNNKHQPIIKKMMLINSKNRSNKLF